MPSKFVGPQHVLKEIFMLSDVELKDMDKFVCLKHILEKSSVCFIRCLLDSFKDEKKQFVHDNQRKVTIQLKQIKTFFAGFFNTDDAIITNIMKEQNTRILMLVDLKLKPSILAGVMFTTSSVFQGAFIYYLLTDPS